METLSAMMLASPEVLQAIYREPSITAYNRLEARPRAEDFTRSLRAEVRDALWMLTRQWQMGELEAEDAGSPVDARLLTRELRVDRVALGDGPGQSYDDSVPLETLVEREPIPFSHALRVQAGQYFLRLHTAALRTKYLPRYRAAFPFAQDDEARFRGQVNGMNLYLATRGGAFDGGLLRDAIVAGTFAADVGVDAGDEGDLNGFAAQFLGWLRRQYSQPEPGAGDAWETERLSYRFSAAAPTGTSQLSLHAERYSEGRVDWYSFDLDPRAAPLGADEGHVPPEAVEEVTSFLPTAAVFKGMPNPRFWEMEERQINFGSLNARTTDHLLLVFAEMGLVYGNDWFVIPYRMPVNTLCEVGGLVVTDVFGERTLVRAAAEGEENEWQRWSLFNLSNRGQIGRYNRQFFLPAALGATLESDPVEQVQFVRDETANLVWAIEEVIPDATGQGISGHDAADKTGVQAEPIMNSPAPVRYLLGTTVPENWIPFLPVHRPGSNRDIAFQRAAMPQLGTPPRDVVRAKGVLLNEPVQPWFVNEEEIPYAGRIVKRTWQRTRWYDGRTYLWLGRRCETGRGVGSSGLRFDQIEPVTPGTDGGS